MAEGGHDRESGEAGAEAAAAMHPFAGYVRTVGRGPGLGRALSEAEAEDAMAAILEGRAEPEQIGAFLVVLRYRKETPAELAGFVRAARARLIDLQGLAADLDWPSYADRHKQLPYFVLAALLLGQAGVRVAMHGLEGEGDATTPAVLAKLGIGPATTAAAAAAMLAQRGLVYLPVEALCPPLAGLFALRPKLGVRTAVNSLARALNPLAAPAQMIGVFHPTYCRPHAETARLLGQPRAVIFKGGGGEAQRNPEKACRVTAVVDGAIVEETWPAHPGAGRHPWRDEALAPGAVAALWRGERRAPGPEAAVVATAAVGLRLAGRAASMDEAEALAGRLWAVRAAAASPAAE